MTKPKKRLFLRLRPRKKERSWSCWRKSRHRSTKTSDSGSAMPGNGERRSGQAIEHSGRLTRSDCQTVLQDNTPGDQHTIPLRVLYSAHCAWSTTLCVRMFPLLVRSLPLSAPALHARLPGPDWTCLAHDCACVLFALCNQIVARGHYSAMRRSQHVHWLRVRELYSIGLQQMFISNPIRDKVTCDTYSQLHLRGVMTNVCKHAKNHTWELCVNMYTRTCM